MDSELLDSTNMQLLAKYKLIQSQIKYWFSLVIQLLFLEKLIHIK